MEEVHKGLWRDIQHAGHGQGPSHCTQQVEGLREDVVKLKTEFRKQARTSAVWQTQPMKKDQKDCCSIEKKRLRRDMLIAFNYVKGC